VRAVFTTRSGGVSHAPFDSFNLGDHVQDDPADVLHNRQLLQRSIGARPVFLQQVHGVAVASLDARTPDGTVADACITAQRDVACTIMVADCLPLLFTDRAGSFVAAAHAGWRGLVGQGGVGVIEAICASFRPVGQWNIAGAAPKIVVDDILVWLGPCIGPAQFEVGSEVKTAFEVAQAGAAQHFQKIQPAAASAVGQPDKYLANLQALARDRLRALGITHIYGNDGSAPWCTVGNPSQFFSHRRDTVRLGSTGRMAACIWLD
jgi:polyphenol oxidase